MEEKFPIETRLDPFMNYSTILVSTRPGELELAVAAVSCLPGIETHQQDVGTARLICTIEAPDTDEAVRRFQAVAALDCVRDVSLIEHRPDAF